MKELWKKEPALIIGSLITLVESLAITGAARIIAVLTFIGAIATRQVVYSPATVEGLPPNERPIMEKPNPQEEEEQEDQQEEEQEETESQPM